MMVYLWLATAVVSTVAYHLVLKATPAAANPFLLLTCTYAIATLMFFGGYALTAGGAAVRTDLQGVSWTPIALAGAIVLLDIGYFMLYRSGYELSLGQLVTQSAAAMLLVVLGLALFREKLSSANVAGIVLCLAGLWLVNKR